MQFLSAAPPKHIRRVTARFMVNQSSVHPDNQKELSATIELLMPILANCEPCDFNLVVEDGEYGSISKHEHKRVHEFIVKTFTEMGEGILGRQIKARKGDVVIWKTEKDPTIYAVVPEVPPFPQDAMDLTHRRK
ncbi:uncharacterized protein LTR77_002966 [Saxophila tyrrhenica]|uniref:Uncharacterized protein n=1 Tax=Saxophila tyrrhenica TaxID=1690608 RepID=A0AAV9PH02_9PEZI|nr:hypothetical protein LTR77_002966 [Saxophila tyrrhenica]